VTAVAFNTSERQIVIDRLEFVRAGRSANGGGWKLSTVHANELDGTPIDTVILRTFDNLVGAVNVTFEPYMDKGSVSHYTVKRSKTAAEVSGRRRVARAAIMGEPAPAAPTPDLLGRLAAAEQRIADLEGRFTLLAGLLGKDA
jgi:hypothetical protein